MLVYMVLQPVRRTDQRILLPLRWALTPPFHPYPQKAFKGPNRRLFSVTLLHPHEHQAINLHSTLRCSDFPPPPEDGSDEANLPDKDSNNIIKKRVSQKIETLFSIKDSPKRYGLECYTKTKLHVPTRAILVETDHLRTIPAICWSVYTVCALDRFDLKWVSTIS